MYIHYTYSAQYVVHEHCSMHIAHIYINMHSKCVNSTISIPQNITSIFSACISLELIAHTHTHCCFRDFTHCNALVVILLLSFHFSASLICVRFSKRKKVNDKIFTCNEPYSHTRTNKVVVSSVLQSLALCFRIKYFNYCSLTYRKTTSTTKLQHIHKKTRNKNKER